MYIGQVPNYLTITSRPKQAISKILGSLYQYCDNVTVVNHQEAVSVSLNIGGAESLCVQLAFPAEHAMIIGTLGFDPHFPLLAFPGSHTIWVRFRVAERI